MSAAETEGGKTEKFIQCHVADMHCSFTELSPDTQLHYNSVCWG